MLSKWSWSRRWRQPGFLEAPPWLGFRPGLFVKLELEVLVRKHWLGQSGPHAQARRGGPDTNMTGKGEGGG